MGEAGERHPRAQPGQIHHDLLTDADTATGHQRGLTHQSTHLPATSPVLVSTCPRRTYSYRPVLVAPTYRRVLGAPACGRVLVAPTFRRGLCAPLCRL